MNFISALSGRFSQYPGGIGSKAVSGGVWLGAGSAAENGLRLFRNMILARIMAPEAFGLLAIILAINSFFEAFTQIGVKESVIQNPGGAEKNYLNAAFWLSALRGILLYFIAFYLIVPLSGFYNKPELVPMLRLAIFNVILAGSISPGAYAALKKMDYRRWTLINNGGSLAGIITAIILGFMIRNTWALVIGFTVENAGRVLISYIICPFRPGLQFDRASLKSLVQFAKGIFGLPVIVFLFERMDVFVLGKFVESSELGMYTLAFGLSQIPVLFFSSVIIPILLPSFSYFNNNPALLIQGIFKTLRYLALSFLPILTLMACASSEILGFVYGAQYSQVNVVFIVFCASTALKMIGTVLATALFAIGKPGYTREASIVRLCVMVILIVPMVKSWGLTGAAVAALVSGMAWIIVALARVSRAIGFSPVGLGKSLYEGCMACLTLAGIYIFLFRWS